MRIDDRFRWLLWFSLVEIGTMRVTLNASSLLPVFRKEGALSNRRAGGINCSCQIGYPLAVICLLAAPLIFMLK